VIFCLYTQTGACTGVAHNPAITLTPISVPQFGFLIIRAYTDNIQNPPCGPDGCVWLLTLAQGYWQSNPISSVGAFPGIKPYVATYNPTMNSGQSDGCSYTYPPLQSCTGNPNGFWDALCQGLADNPLTLNSPEAIYVNTNFAALGITSTGCSSLNYQALAGGFALGYGVLQTNVASAPTLTRQGIWSTIQFTDQWGASSFDINAALLRAIASYRLEYMNSNAVAMYWVAYTDSTGTPLNAAWGVTYTLTWANPGIAIVDPTYGFWSVTAYDTSNYLYFPPDTDRHQYAVRGKGTVPSGSIDFSNTCVSSSCIRVTPGAFYIMIRAYVPLPSIQPGGTFQLPSITKCLCNAPCT